MSETGFHSCALRISINIFRSPGFAASTGRTRDCTTPNRMESLASGTVE